MYILKGKDPSSFSGQFTIIVNVLTVKDALHSAKEFLIGKGRKELFNEINYVHKLESKYVCYSDVNYKPITKS